MNQVAARHSIEPVPIFNLRNLPDDAYPSWRDRYVEKARDYRPDLRMVARNVMRSGDLQHKLHSYVLVAYEYALHWEAEEIAEEMIFGATFLTNQGAFRHDVDVFTAALCLGLKRSEAKRAKIKLCVRACEYAWLHRWDCRRFELELLRYGVWGVGGLDDDVTKHVQRMGDNGGRSQTLKQEPRRRQMIVDSDD
jgi:hypothetical protein